LRRSHAVPEGMGDLAVKRPGWRPLWPAPARTRRGSRSDPGRCRLQRSQSQPTVAAVTLRGSDDDQRAQRGLTRIQAEQICAPRFAPSTAHRRTRSRRHVCDNTIAPHGGDLTPLSSNQRNYKCSVLLSNSRAKSLSIIGLEAFSNGCNCKRARVRFPHAADVGNHRGSAPDRGSANHWSPVRSAPRRLPPPNPAREAANPKRPQPP